jgi:two-component system, OmpR family, phosphate regulon sensor histidine kinase PhoR
MLGSTSARIGAAFLLLIAATFAALAVGSVVGAAAIAIITAVALTLVLRVAISQPLGRITHAVRGIAAGNLQERVSPRPPGEIGELADAFNQMAHRVEDLVLTASQDHDRMLAALNSSADALVALNSNDAIAFANAAAERILLRPLHGMTGNPFAWVMSNAQVIDALRSSREEGQSRSLVVERPYRQYLQVIVTPIIDGGDWASLVVFHDISEVRRAEVMRRDFVANVSHELRTPLAALKSVIETLRTGAVEDPELARDFLSRADAELDRLVQMVEELLQLSRIESGEVPLTLQPLEIREILATAVDRMEPQANKHGLNLTVNVDSAVPSVVVDRVLLERAVINLIDNAVKFTSEGGSIVVSAHSTDGMVTVEVRDTGEGIDPMDLPRVFERFYKADRARRAGGTGLGLAIVKHTIEAHGGNVKAESDPGRGSMFGFSIPARPAP